MAFFRRITTSAEFWGRTGGYRIPPVDACFFCGRRESPFCQTCYVSICGQCEDPARRGKLLPIHPPEAHRARASQLFVRESEVAVRRAEAHRSRGTLYRRRKGIRARVYRAVAP